MTGLSIRPARQGDVDQLVGLMRDFYGDDGDPFGEDESRACFRTLVSDSLWGRVFVADDGDSLAGYAALTFGFSMEFGGRDAFIDDLYVAATHRGKGLGRALIGACEQACVDAGVRALHLAVRPGNPAAALYRRVGFRERQHRLMTKRIAAPE